MEPDDLLCATRTAFSARARAIADLVRAQQDAATPLPGSAWTVREAAVHLTVIGNLAAEAVTGGAPSPVTDLGPDSLAAWNAALIADIPQTDPVKLAALLTDAADRFLSVTAGRPGDQPLTFHAGLPFTLAEAAGNALAEYLLHGYDIALALRCVWSLTAVEAGLVLRTASSPPGPWPSCLSQRAGSHPLVAFALGLVETQSS